MSEPGDDGLRGCPVGAPLVVNRPDGERQRPWWGPIDILGGAVFIFVVSTVGAVIAGMIASAFGDWSFGATTDLPVYALFCAVLAQQAGQGLWPWVVSRRKGLGIASDWGFGFDLPRDIGAGVLLALVCVFGAGAVNAIVSSLVSLPADEDPSNTSIISDHRGSPWLVAVILLVVIGAPLTEELLFRGLVLSALEKWLGKYLAVAGSTVLFALPHFQPGATWREATVLLASIATIGLLLAIDVVRNRRLGPAIIAHLLFNGYGTVATLVG